MRIAAILAVGTAALSLVAGLGTYLYIRFTQHRRKGSKAAETPAGQSFTPANETDRRRPA
ncbi:MAG TPA: hypothetical protein VN317_07650 [Candidatus Methanoperedens sp.]|nr:hypothetical protein [Candidatus Methanoperedens sp.]